MPKQLQLDLFAPAISRGDRVSFWGKYRGTVVEVSEGAVRVKWYHDSEPQAQFGWVKLDAVTLTSRRGR
jgi:hypothetical protein